MAIILIISEIMEYKKGGITQNNLSLLVSSILTIATINIIILYMKLNKRSMQNY